MNKKIVEKAIFQFYYYDKHGNYNIDYIKVNFDNFLSTYNNVALN